MKRKSVFFTFLICLVVAVSLSGCQQKTRVTVKVTGTVQSVTENGNQITITYGDNNVQTFDIGDTNLETKVQKGTKVTVWYKDLVTDVAPEVIKAVKIKIVKQLG